MPSPIFLFLPFIFVSLQLWLTRLQRAKVGSIDSHGLFTMVRTLILLSLIRFYPNLFIRKLGRVVRHTPSFTNKNILAKT